MSYSLARWSCIEFALGRTTTCSSIESMSDAWWHFEQVVVMVALKVANGEDFAGTSIFPLRHNNNNNNHAVSANRATRVGLVVTMARIASHAP